jgi:hypothetical protein
MNASTHLPFVIDLLAALVLASATRVVVGIWEPHGWWLVAFYVPMMMLQPCAKRPDQAMRRRVWFVVMIGIGVGLVIAPAPVLGWWLLTP